MLVISTQPDFECRTVVVPECDDVISMAQDASIEALALFQMRLRDTVDFTVDFTKWLAKNGRATISDAVFSAATSSPATPVIAGQAFNAMGKCVVLLSKHVGAKAGDAYHLDITVTVAATTPTGPGEVAIPERTLVRRINVVLVNG